MPAVEMRVCLLARAIGMDGSCPESDACSYWESGLAKMGGRCGIERLGLDRLGSAESAFLLERREDVHSRGGLALWPHPPGF